MYTVNLRSRTDPPQPQSSFGNLFSIAIAIPISKNGDEGQGLVRLERVTQKSNVTLDFFTHEKGSPTLNNNKKN